MWWITVCLLLISFNSECQTSWTLQRCIDTAILKNNNARLSTIEVDIASMKSNDFSYGYLPSVNGGASHGYNWGQTIDPFTNQFATDRVQFNNFFLTSSIDLFSGFSRIKSQELLLLNKTAAEVNRDRIQLEMIVDITTAFLQIELNKEILLAAKQSLFSSKQELELVEKMVEEGFKTNSDLINLNAILARDKYFVSQVESDILKSEILLQQIIGLDLDTSFHTTTSMPSEFEGVTQGQIENRISQVDLDAKQAEINITKGQFYPSLSVVGSLGSGYSENNQTLNPDGSLSPKPFRDQFQENFYQSASVSLSVPIFNGNKNRSALKIKELELEKIKVENESRQREFENRILELKLEVSQKQHLVKSASIMYEAALLSFDNDLLRFREGAINSVDFENSKNELRNAKSELSQAEYGLVFAKFILTIFSQP